MIWWVFRNAVVRKVAYVLVAVVASFVFGHRAHSQGFIFPNQGTNQGQVSQAATGQQWCNQWLAVFNVFWVTQQGGSPETSVTVSGQSGVPLSLNDTASCLTHPVAGAAQVTRPVAGSLGCSASSPNLDLLTTMGGATGYTSGGGYCSGGCEYTNGNLAVTFGGGGQRLAGKAVPTGNACGVQGTLTATQAVASNQGCLVKAGVTTCVDSGDGTVTQQNVPGGTFSVVSPNLPAVPSTCAGYPDGGLACNAGTSGAMPTPPGPSTAASILTPATPTLQVSGATGSNVVNYYNPATALSSKGPVPTIAGIGGNPAGTTTATGSGNGTSGSPCPAGQTCAGTTDSFSGGQDCVTPPSCTDTDPVQCAQANQEWLFRCESASDSDIASAIGTVTGPVNTTVDSSTALSDHGTDTLNAIMESTGGCPGPIEVTIAGKTLSLDIFSHVCEFAGFLSFVIMAVAYMVAGRIMFQGAVSNSF